MKTTHRKTLIHFDLSFEQEIKNHDSQLKMSSFSKSFSAKYRARIGSSFLTARRPVTGRASSHALSPYLSPLSITLHNVALVLCPIIYALENVAFSLSLFTTAIE